MFDYDSFAHQAGYIKLVDCRHTAHVTMCQHRPPSEPRIDRINEHCYYVRSTEEIRFYEHGETGTKRDHERSIKRAFANLKKLINCNYDVPENIRFFTLTYAENMQDNDRISDDWRQFVKRCRRRYGKFRYIYVKEKQARGAWHLHGFFFFDGPAPWMDNEEVRAMWGQGWVTIEAIKDDLNNLGNYLCAYLTDDKESSKKGARLLNYEAGVRLYNCSRDIRRPVEYVISFDQYQEFLENEDVREISKRDKVIRLKNGRDLRIRYGLYCTDGLYNMQEK